MSDLQAWVAPTCNGLADLLSGLPSSLPSSLPSGFPSGLSTGSADDAWHSPSLCEKWQVRHVVAHLTMPATMTPEQFGAGMAEAGGDFTTFSDGVAARDALRPVAELLDSLRSPRLHSWQPPGGGEAGALTHAVIHSLDVTIALGRPSVAPPKAVTAVLDLLTGAEGTWFGIDLSGVRLEADDTDWAWGTGDVVRGDGGSLVALLSGRALPDGRQLARVGSS